MPSKRLPIVPALSSAARMPLPAAAMALAVAISSAAKGVAAMAGKKALALVSRVTKECATIDRGTGAAKKKKKKQQQQTNKQTKKEKRAFLPGAQHTNNHR